MPNKTTPIQPPSPLGLLVSYLEDMPAPRDAKPEQWAELQKLYKTWHVEVSPRTRQRHWFACKAYRLNKTTEEQASLVAKVLHIYEQHRIWQDRMKRKASGFDQRREIRRREKNPEAYKAAATERQRAHRAKVKLAQQDRRARYEDFVALGPLCEPLSIAESSLDESPSEGPSEAEWRRYDPYADDAANDVYGYAEAAE